MERDNAKVVEKVFPENCGLYSTSCLHFWIVPTRLLAVTDPRYISCSIWFNFLSLPCIYLTNTRHFKMTLNKSCQDQALRISKGLSIREEDSAPNNCYPSTINVGLRRIPIRRVPPREMKTTSTWASNSSPSTLASHSTINPKSHLPFKSHSIACAQHSRSTSSPLFSSNFIQHYCSNTQIISKNFSSLRQHLGHLNLPLFNTIHQHQVGKIASPRKSALSS